MKKQAFLTPKEVCAWLALPSSTLADLRARGEGPAFTRLSAKNIRYTSEDVTSWLERQRHETTASVRR